MRTIDLQDLPSSTETRQCVAAIVDLRIAQRKQDAAFAWGPACGGTEQPFTTRGKTLQYMWNHVTGEHAPRARAP